MPLLKDKTIRKRVLAVIETRIQQAQTSYDDGCMKLDETLEEEVRDAEIRCEQGKTDLADTLVTGILGKTI